MATVLLEIRKTHSRLTVNLKLLILITTRTIYRLYFHPLSAYPGPTLYAASRLPLFNASIRGHSVHLLPRLHAKYGPVVRIAPNELSYTTATAWKTIYGHRGEEMAKDLQGAGLTRPPNGEHGILTADRENHARMRRLISHAFSDKALREQEGFLQEYVGLLIKGLMEHAGKGSVDLVMRYNWYVFRRYRAIVSSTDALNLLQDNFRWYVHSSRAACAASTVNKLTNILPKVIGDLSFGSSFSCLATQTPDPWITSLFTAIRIVPYIQALMYYNLLWLLKYIVPQKMLVARARTQASQREKLARRLAMGPDETRKDFLSYILRHNDAAKAAEGNGEGTMAKGKEALTPGEIFTNSSALIIAGSETTATLLSGVTWHLLRRRNRRVYEKLCAEIRAAFADAQQITMKSVSELKYLTAVLDEGMRLYPPAPAALPRVVPKGGEVIDGRFVPGGVRRVQLSFPLLSSLTRTPFPVRQYYSTTVTRKYHALFRTSTIKLTTHPTPNRQQ